MSTATKRPDVLVVGLGAMGSATACRLAIMGARVVGIDQFTPPHTFGSSHGETRITREATGEGMQFVPLVMRSHQLWREIERETGDTLLTVCGGIMLARKDKTSHLHAQPDFLGNTIRAAETFGIAHECLTAAEIANRYPQLILQGDEVAYFEPGAGYLAPEACVRAQLRLATKHGAALQFGETVRRLSRVDGGMIVETDRARYAAAVTIVAAGPWLAQLLPRMASRVSVRRQVLYWFAVDAKASYSAAHMPIFIWNWGAGDADVFYGFPQVGAAREIKVATEQVISSTTPGAVDRQVADAEIATMYRNHVAGRLAGIGPRCLRAATCLYTSTPNANFAIDRLPDAHDTIVVSACSGHGFKHSAAIGEAVAQMAISGLTPDVLKPFAF